VLIFLDIFARAFFKAHSISSRVESFLPLQHPTAAYSKP